MPNRIILALIVPGEPIGKARPRVMPRGWTYTPKRTVEAEKLIAGLARAALPAGFQPVDEPLQAVLHFYAKNKRRIDIDNRIKLVFDALNKIVYVDDYLVRRVVAQVEYVDDPFTSITIATWIKGEAK